MFTEYIFENRKYEVAVRDLKSILFDLVAIENGKLSDIEMRLSREINPDMQNRLQALYEKQNACLKRALEISSELSTSLMELDSYSKELNKLEKGNVAEMITELGDKKIEKAYQKDVLNAKQERDDIANNMIKTANGLEEDSMIQKGDIIGNIRTIQQGVEGSDEDSMASLQMPIEKNDVTFVTDDASKEDSEIAIESSAAGEMEDSNDAIEPETSEEEDEVATEDENDEEIVSESTVDDEIEGAKDIAETVVSDEEKANAENMATSADESEVVENSETYQDDSTAEEDGEIPEDKTEENDSERVNSFNDVSDLLPEINLTQNLEVEKNESVPIPQVVNSEVTTPQETAGTDAEETVNNSQQIDIPVVSDIVDKQEAIALENKKLSQEADMGIIQKIKFLKSNADVTRAIITAKKQIANLRNSRETAKALLEVKRSVADIPIAVETKQAIDKSLEDEQAMEQKLIANGLLEPATVDKQRKIEEMLEKANSLYKEGKTEEARDMYDQISILNRESQVTDAAVKK